VLVVGGPATAPADAIAVATALAERRPFFVAEVPSSVLALFEARAQVPVHETSTAGGLVHPEIGLVVILSGCRLIPDVALALGLAVVSERAPLLADWALVPTVVQRELRGRSAPTFADVLADDLLRRWVTEAASYSLCHRFPPVSPVDAVDAVTNLVRRQQHMDAVGLGQVAEYLDETDAEWIAPFTER
jgi:hypothetical protein